MNLNRIPNLLTNKCTGISIFLLIIFSDRVFSETRFVDSIFSTEEPDTCSQDIDADGVIDCSDFDLNTPAFAPVDFRGQNVDSDSDGIYDFEDDEPAPDIQMQYGSEAKALALKIWLADFFVYKMPLRKYSTMCTNTILFDFKSFEIRPDAVPEMEYLSDVLINYPRLHLQLTGHIDSLEAIDLLDDLSMKRTEAIINYLLKKGIAEQRLIINHTVFYLNAHEGSDNPIGHLLNQRVDPNFFQTY